MRVSDDAKFIGASIKEAAKIIAGAIQSGQGARRYSVPEDKANEIIKQCFKDGGLKILDRVPESGPLAETKNNSKGGGAGIRE